MSQAVPCAAPASAEQFFMALADCCNVAEAARRSGMSFDMLETMARDCPSFAERWQQALATAYDRLEWEMLERARFGNPDPKRYNDAHALRMLARHHGEREKSTAQDHGPLIAPARLDAIMLRLRPMVDAIEEKRGEAE